jgi:hypothetical protein
MHHHRSCGRNFPERRSARLTGNPLVFMNSMGLQKMTFVPPRLASASSAPMPRAWRRLAPARCMSSSTTMKPALCRLPAYCRPGLPRPDHQPHRSGPARQTPNWPTCPSSRLSCHPRQMRPCHPRQVRPWHPRRQGRPWHPRRRQEPRAAPWGSPAAGAAPSAGTAPSAATTAVSTSTFST